MSSPKAAATKVRSAQARSAVKRAHAQPSAKPTRPARAAKLPRKDENGDAVSAQAVQLAAEIERALASGRLKAANLAVFELGMWQSWTGR